MHKLQMYENLRDMLEREVQEIQKEGNLDTQKLDNLYKLMSAMKHTNECIEEESMEGASYEGRGRSRGSYERSRGSYGRGGSYERGRGGRSNDYMMPYSMDVEEAEALTKGAEVLTEVEAPMKEAEAEAEEVMIT